MAATVGLFEAKQRLSELVRRAARGEEITITCRGKEAARLVRAVAKRQRSLEEILSSMASTRMKLAKGETLKDLIEQGRRH